MMSNEMKFVICLAMFVSVKKTIEDYNKPLFPKKNVRKYNIFSN